MFNPLKVIVDTETRFMVEPPRGKPDPNQPYEEGKEREVVPQPPQKYHTCWYYAVKFFHPNLGKHPPILHNKEKGEEFDRMRKIEEIVSDLRKDVSLYDCIEKYQLFRFHFKRYKLNPKTNEELEVNELINQGINWDFYQIKSKVTEVLKNFSKQTKNENLLEYILSEYDPVESTNRFIKRLAQIPNALHINKLLPIFQKCISEKFELQATQERVTINNKKLVIGVRSVSNQVRSLLAEFAYGMEKSLWTPDDSIEIFAKKLKNEGGMLHISGLFCSAKYLLAPKEYKERIAGKVIHFWPKGSLMRESNVSVPVDSVYSPPSHAIVVIGVDTLSKMVFFIEPYDGDDLKTQRKIYMISYTNLQNSVYDSSCCMKRELSFAGKEGAIWATYHPKMSYK